MAIITLSLRYDIDSTSNTISLNMISSHGPFNANRSITENTNDYRPPNQSERSIYTNVIYWGSKFKNAITAAILDVIWTCNRYSNNYLRLPFLKFDVGYNLWFVVYQSFKSRRTIIVIPLCIKIEIFGYYRNNVWITANRRITCVF